MKLHYQGLTLLLNAQNNITRVHYGHCEGKSCLKKDVSYGWCDTMTGDYLFQRPLSTVEYAVV